MRTRTFPTVAENQMLGQVRKLPTKMKKTVPFDYVFKFALTGNRGNKIQDVLEISIEGIFVATSVGYSLMLDEDRTPRSFAPVIDQRTLPHNPVIVPFFDNQGKLEAILMAGMPEAEIDILNLTETTPPDAPSKLGTGRIGSDGTVMINLQNPMDTGIIRVWDKTNNLLSQLFSVSSPIIVLSGSTPLSSPAVPSTPVIGPNPATNRLLAAADSIVHIYGSPGHEVNVYLLESSTANIIQVGKFNLEETITFGKRTGRVEPPLQLNTPLSPGDVLLVQSATPGETVVPFSMYTIPRLKPSTITLGTIVAGLERIGADLTMGFRLNPNFTRLAIADLPFDQISLDDRDKIFETGCVAAEEVSFLYRIDVVGTGRELQNQSIHNIAGLGIANGDRPFRPFAKPMMIAPRSSVSIQIEELSGPPGTLFIVLQGYKILGTGRAPA